MVYVHATRKSICRLSVRPLVIGPTTELFYYGLVVFFNPVLRRAEGPDSIKNANLFVGNLPLSWKEGDLERAFTPHGKVIKCKVLIDQLTGISRGSGFVLFSKNAEAENALKGEWVLHLFVRLSLPLSVRPSVL